MGWREELLAENKRRAEVMLAAEYGDDGVCTNIEYANHGYTNYVPAVTPIWDWVSTNYRVMPKREVYYAKVWRFGCIGFGFESVKKLIDSSVGENVVAVLQLTYENDKLVESKIIELDEVKNETA